MQRFKNILCVITADADSEAALTRAVALAHRNQADLTLIEVIDEIPPDTRLLERVLASSDLQAKVVAEHQQRLERLAAPHREVVAIQTRVATGIPFLEIIREVLQQQRDLVIKSTEKGGPLERLFGSDEMHLLRKCPCPVWLLKPDSPARYRTLLAAVDVGDDYPPEELESRHRLNLQILEMASALALSEFAELHIVHAWEAMGESALHHALVDTPPEKIRAYVEAVKQQHNRNLERLLSEVIGELGEEAVDYITPQTHLIKGPARREIPALAKAIGAELVVMGTVARTGIPGLFMGNTAETIINRLDCALLAVKPPGFVTPVTPQHTP